MPLTATRTVLSPRPTEVPHGRPSRSPAQAEALLEKADATPPGTWHITAEEHSTLISLAEAFNVELPVATFRSSEGVTRFLRLCAAKPPVLRTVYCTWTDGELRRRV